MLQVPGQIFLWSLWQQGNKVQQIASKYFSQTSFNLWLICNMLGILLSSWNTTRAGKKCGAKWETWVTNTIKKVWMSESKWRQWQPAFTLYVSFIQNLLLRVWYWTRSSTCMSFNIWMIQSHWPHCYIFFRMMYNHIKAISVRKFVEIFSVTQL